MTVGITFLKWPMHFSTLTVCQNDTIPSINCCCVWGFTSRLIYSLSSCHKFSIGFMSGDSGGVHHQLMALSSKKACACFDVCLGSLSCLNLWPSGSVCSRKGTNVWSRIMVYSGAFIFPSKIQTSVGPLLLIPAHTCTLVGCFALSIY